jgi:hypothetical protein
MFFHVKVLIMREDIMPDVKRQVAVAGGLFESPNAGIRPISRSSSSGVMLRQIEPLNFGSGWIKIRL